VDNACAVHGNGSDHFILNQVNNNWRKADFNWVRTHAEDYGLSFFLALIMAVTTALKSFAASILGRPERKSLKLPLLKGFPTLSSWTLLFLDLSLQVFISFRDIGLYFLATQNITRGDE